MPDNRARCRNASQYPSFEPDCPNEYTEVLAQGAVGVVVVATPLTCEAIVTGVSGLNKAIPARFQF
jgi:hypothetical protein